MQCELKSSLNLLVLEVSLKDEKTFCMWKQMLAVCFKEVKDVKVALCGAEIKASMKTFQKVNITNTDIPVWKPA